VPPDREETAVTFEFVTLREHLEAQVNRHRERGGERERERGLVPSPEAWA
jgi:hypothetical protein